MADSTMNWGGKVFKIIDLGDGTFALAIGTASGASDTVVLGAGTALVGKVGIDQTTPGTTDHVSATPMPATGAVYATSTYENDGAATAAFIKASAGNVYSLRVTNANAAVRYIQLHNKATIPLATEVPTLKFLIPGGTAAQPGSVEIDSAYFGPSKNFPTGIGYAISTTIGTFTDSATANEHTVQVNYK